MPALHRAPDLAHGTEPVPGLADLIEISWRPNFLTVGVALVGPPNFGQDSTMQPVQGWTYHPTLNAAAGPAPRDTQIPVYINCPPPPNSKYARVPPALMRAAQQNKTQVISPGGPVDYVPGGTASLYGGS